MRPTLRLGRSSAAIDKSLQRNLAVRLDFLCILCTIGLGDPQVTPKITISFNTNSLAMDAILSFDIGGTFIRGALFSLEGELAAMRGTPAQAGYLDSQGCEADSDYWWQTVRRLAEELLSQAAPQKINLMGIVSCGMTRTQILLDAKGAPLGPAITFRDQRARDQAHSLARISGNGSAAPDQAGYRPISAFHPLARLMWLAEHEPQIMAQTRWVLQPKDYISWRLTGKPAADAISSASYSVGDGVWPGPELFSRLGIDPGIIPVRSRPQDPVGRVISGCEPPFDRHAGTMVFNGSMDAWCGTLGIGAVRPGFGYNITGTTESLGLVCEQPVKAPGLLSLPWGGGLNQIGGPSQAGGDCLTWLLENLYPQAESIPRVFKGLNTLPQSGNAPGPLFLPYLAGERTPLWNPEACGVFFGLRRFHQPADLIRSVMQGVAFANRHVLELAEQAAGLRASEIRVTGGAARLDSWCRIKADVMNRPVVRTGQEEAGLLGAALLAILGLGRYEDLASLQKGLVHEERRFTPDPRAAARHQRAYRLYRDLITRLTPCFSDFAGLAGPDMESSADA